MRLFSGRFDHVEAVAPHFLFLAKNGPKMVQNFGGLRGGFVLERPYPGQFLLRNKMRLFSGRFEPVEAIFGRFLGQKS